MSALTEICDNFQLPVEIQDQVVGYSYIISKSAYITLAALSVIVGIISIIILYSKNKKTKEASSPIDKFTFILSFNEIISAVYYLIVSSVLYKPENQVDLCVLSFTLSLVEYFNFLFKLSFTACKILQLKTMILDPIKGILQSQKKFKIYLIFSLLTSAFGTFSLYILDIFGYSVVLTPLFRSFLSVDNPINIKQILILAAPTLFYLIIAYMNISIFFNHNFRRDKELVLIYTKTVTFSFLLLLANFPFLLLNYLALGHVTLINSSLLQALALLVYIVGCTQGMILGLVKLLLKYINCSKIWKKLKFNNRKVSLLSQDKEDFYRVEEKLLQRVRYLYI